MKLCKVMRFNIIVAIPLLISSCMSIQKYPSEWPPLIDIEDQICPNISGSYVNDGEKTDGIITSLLGKWEATHFQINQLHDDTLEILFLDNDTLVDKNIYSKKKGEYSCTPEGVRISFGTKASTQIGEGLMPVSLNWASLYLTKNTDGELVVKATSSGMGLVVVFPVAGYAADYARFKQKQE